MRSPRLHRRRKDGPDVTGTRHEPWIVRGAITFLEAYLQPHMSVLEWGGGDSTPWLARRVSTLVTVEHDAVWADLLRGELRDRYPGWRCILFPPEPDGDALYRGHGQNPWFFRRYVEDVPTGPYDLVIVDGRARAACLAKAPAIVRPAGVVMLDNSNRERYSMAMSAVPPSWHRQDFVTAWRTTFWTVPKGSPR